MLQMRYIGSSVRSLIHELTLLSGKQFRAECRLNSDEMLNPERRIELINLLPRYGKVLVVDSFHELTNYIHEADMWLVDQQQVVQGFERIYMKFHELLMKRWIIAADKYKRGYDPNPDTEFRTWAYGLIEVDKTLLNDLRSILEETEKEIAELSKKFNSNRVDSHRLEDLTNKLESAGIPLQGCNYTHILKPENDASPCEYIELRSGEFVRVHLKDVSLLTDEERQIARNIILEHEKETERLNEICEAVRIGLIRNGHKVSSVRLTKSEKDLQFDPTQFVALDTDIGILEIRLHESIEVHQREQIITVAIERLTSLSVNVDIPLKSDSTVSRTIEPTSILFLSSDPKDADRLRLDEEYREIQEALKKSTYRDEFRLEPPQLSARSLDMFQSLLQNKPDIVHFSGHGSNSGKICLENRAGETQLVEANALAELFENLTNQVSCVVLNACFSEMQADAIIKHVDYIIGMQKEVDDEAAIAFSRAFYYALGEKYTIEKAYNLAKASLWVDGYNHHTPVLRKKS